MHTDHEPLDPDTLAEMGYERRDINVPALRRWTIGFFGLVAIFFVLGWIFYKFLAPTTFVRAARGVAPVTRRIPAAPNPILQDDITTKLDIMTMRQEEEEALTSYGWANKERTAVRLPIDRAMALIAERGVPGGKEVGTPVKPSPRNVLGTGSATKAPGAASTGDTSPNMPIPSQSSQAGSPNAAAASDGKTSDGQTLQAPPVAPGAGRSPNAPAGPNPTLK